MKKIFSLLLAFVLIFTLAAGVFATEEPKKPVQPEETATEETAAVRVNNSYGAFYYSNLEQALYTCAYESAGRTTITLLQDVDLTGLEPATEEYFMTGYMGVAAPGALMLDLNGYSLTFSGDVTLLNQLTAATVTVKNGTVFYTPADGSATFRQSPLFMAIPEEEEVVEEVEETTEEAETAETDVTEETAEETAETAPPAEPEKKEIKAPVTRLTLQNLVVWNLGGGQIIRTLNHSCVITVQNCLLWSAGKAAAVQAQRPTYKELAENTDPENYLPYEGEFKPQIIIKNSVVGSSFGYALMTEKGAAAAVIDSVLASGGKKPVADGSFITSNVQGEAAAWQQKLPDGSTVTAEAVIYGEAPDADAMPDLTNLPYVPPAPKPAPKKSLLTKTQLLSLCSSAVVIALIVIAVPKKKNEV